ncbi:MAG: hypothetical protein EXQ94_13050 [Alphaproteobacteria bacterium]|nr:hypothetical protein [Alphaproteobacteria bacterium]
MDSDTLWLVIGFAGQGLFALRFIVQWVHSERRRESVVPVVFWYISIGGGAVLLAYALHRLDPVFITGQLLGLFVYSRNLALIRGSRLRAARAESDREP